MPKASIQVKASLSRKPRKTTALSGNSITHNRAIKRQYRKLPQPVAIIEGRCPCALS